MCYLFYEQYMNNIMHISGEKEQYGVSHRNKKSLHTEAFLFYEREWKIGMVSSSFPTSCGAEIPPIRMIGFEDGLSQFFGDIRAQPLYGAFEPFVGVTVPEIAFAFQVEDQIKLVSIMGKQRFGRGPARMFVPYGHDVFFQPCAFHRVFQRVALA